MRKIIAITLEPPTPSEIRRVGPRTKRLPTRLPPEHEVLDVQAEAGGGTIKLFLEVPEEYLDTQDKWEVTTIVVKQNGDFVDDDLDYIGSVQIASAAYTWHVYYEQ